MKKFFVFLIVVALITGGFYSCEKKEEPVSETATEGFIDEAELVADYDISPYELAEYAFNLSTQMDEARLSGDDDLLEDLLEKEEELTGLFNQLSESDSEIFVIEFSRLMAEHEGSLED